MSGEGLICIAHSRELHVVLAVTLQVLKALSNLLVKPEAHTVLALAHDGVGVGDDVVPSLDERPLRV